MKFEAVEKFKFLRISAYSGQKRCASALLLEFYRNNQEIILYDTTDKDSVKHQYTLEIIDNKKQ